MHHYICLEVNKLYFVNWYKNVFTGYIGHYYFSFVKGVCDAQIVYMIHYLQFMVHNTEFIPCNANKCSIYPRDELFIDQNWLNLLNMHMDTKSYIFYKFN